MQTTPIAPALVESWLNEPAGREHVVLGRRLRPYCSWHRLLLEAIDSPLLRPEGKPSLTDLDAATRICQARYRDPLAQIFPGPPRRWATRAWRRGRAVWIASRYPVPAALGALTRYLRDYVAPPELWQEDGAGAAETQNHLPDVLTVPLHLMANGFSEVEAWEMPLGKAQWYVVGFAKINGADIRLRTESDELFNALRTLKARIAARKAAQP